MLGLTPFKLLSAPIRVILLINLVVFSIAFLGNMLGLGFLQAHLVDLALVPALYSEVWRLVTYAFVHVQPMHFIFNMLMFWMFGQEVAQWLGQRTFIALYLFSAIFAALFSIPFYMMHLMMGNAVIIGASGALFGVMVAYSRLFPERMLLIFFVFPMRIKYAIWVFIGIDLLMVNSGDSIAHLTHLGGVAAGFAFMFAWQHGWKLPSATPKKVPTPPGVLEGELGYWKADEQLDAILAKINNSGMSSLSPNEVNYLQQASAKRRQRF